MRIPKLAVALAAPLLLASCQRTPASQTQPADQASADSTDSTTSDTTAIAADMVNSPDQGALDPELGLSAREEYATLSLERLIGHDEYHTPEFYGGAFFGQGRFNVYLLKPKDMTQQTFDSLWYGLARNKGIRLLHGRFSNSYIWTLCDSIGQLFNNSNEGHGRNFPTFSGVTVDMEHNCVKVGFIPLTRQVCERFRREVCASPAISFVEERLWIVIIDDDYDPGEDFPLEDPPSRAADTLAAAPPAADTAAIAAP